MPLEALEDAGVEFESFSTNKQTSCRHDRETDGHTHADRPSKYLIVSTSENTEQIMIFVLYVVQNFTTR